MKYTIEAEKFPGTIEKTRNINQVLIVSEL